MKWYTCLNEEGLSRYGEHLRIAVASCRERTSLDPHIVFDGDPEALTAALGRHDVTVHRRQSGLLPDIVGIGEKPGFKHRIAAGAFLRLEICKIEETADFVLYTDCDVMFQRDIDFGDLRPAHLAAAPEMDKQDWSFFNSGVLLMNLDMRNDYDAILAAARPTLGTPHFYDQGVYNDFYAGRWDRLPLTANWKPYWGLGEQASIIHFHGTKLSALHRLVDGRGDAVVHDIWQQMYDANRKAYEHYFREALRYLEG